jgi:hypothetical protein
MGLFTLQYIMAMLVCTLVFEAKRNLLLESTTFQIRTLKKVQNTTRFVKYRIFFSSHAGEVHVSIKKGRNPTDGKPAKLLLEKEMCY